MSFFVNSSFYSAHANSKEKNPFEEEEWDECYNSERALVDSGEPGVPVKALYDYDGAEDDELTFRQGNWIPVSPVACTMTKMSKGSGY